MPRKLRIGLVGGGIGGLSAALALERHGFEVHVFEQAGELREIGAGLAIAPNAFKVLRALGVEEALMARGFEPEAIVGRDWTTARVLFRVPLKNKAAARFGAPLVHVHRADLLDVRETADWVEESWSVPGDARELLAAYGPVHPDLRVLLEQAEHCFKWGLFDRDPLPAWSRGRLTLLGDAAHPMLPFLGQGAAMAIEDGYVLARELARSPNDLPAALRAYDAERVPRTTMVQLAARRQASIFHMTSSLWRLKRLFRNWTGRFDPEKSPDLETEWLYAYDPTRKPA